MVGYALSVGCLLADGVVVDGELLTVGYLDELGDSDG